VGLKRLCGEWERCEAEVCIVAGGSAKPSPPIGPQGQNHPWTQQQEKFRAVPLARCIWRDPSLLLHTQSSRRLAVLLSCGTSASTLRYRDSLGRLSKQSGTRRLLLATPMVHGDVSHPKAWHATCLRPQFDGNHGGFLCECLSPVHE
jgi:hypothetical protein